MAERCPSCTSLWTAVPRAGPWWTAVASDLGSLADLLERGRAPALHRLGAAGAVLDGVEGVGGEPAQADVVLAGRHLVEEALRVEPAQRGEHAQRRDLGDAPALAGEGLLRGSEARGARSRRGEGAHHVRRSAPVGPRRVDVGRQLRRRARPRSGARSGPPPRSDRACPRRAPPRSRGGDEPRRGRRHEDALVGGHARHRGAVHLGRAREAHQRDAQHLVELDEVVEPAPPRRRARRWTWRSAACFSSPRSRRRASSGVGGARAERGEPHHEGVGQLLAHLGQGDRRAGRARGARRRGQAARRPGDVAARSPLPRGR